MMLDVERASRVAEKPFLAKNRSSGRRSQLGQP
jgi:hypothetical protein